MSASSTQFSELTLSLMLLIGAALLIRSFVRLQSVPPGFATDHVLTMEVAAAGRKYQDDKNDKPIVNFRVCRDRYSSVEGNSRGSGGRVARRIAARVAVLFISLYFQRCVSNPDCRISKQTLNVRWSLPPFVVENFDDHTSNIPGAHSPANSERVVGYPEVNRRHVALRVAWGS